MGTRPACRPGAPDLVGQVLLKLVLLFTVVPLVELALLIRVGALLGVEATVAMVVLTGVLGAWLARVQGLRTVVALQQDMAAGRLPAGRLVDGLLILVAGAVLLTPGLLTDALGFFLLVPPGRAVVRRRLRRWFRDRLRIEQPTVIDARWTREEDPP